MGVKIGENIKQHIISWDETRGDLLLKEYQEGSWNSTSGQYDMSLVSTKKVGGADYGHMFDFSSSTVTTISVADTWYLLGCVTTSNYSKGFTHSNGKLTKVGNGYGPFKITAQLTMQDGNNNEIHAGIYLNGVLVEQGWGSIVMDSGGKGNTVSYQCLIELNDGDYIETYVKNVTAATNITLENYSIIINEMV